MVKFMQINLPNNFEDFDNVIYSPFCIFEKKNFLENSVYEKLKENFPNEEKFQGIHQNGNKLYFNNKHDQFFEFIKGNIWGDFYHIFNEKKFLTVLVDLIKPQLKNISNRRKFNNYFFNKKYSQNIIRKITNKLLRKLNYNSIRLGFEFSILKKDCFIPPHCDTENKLLSLMIYFPMDKENFLDLGTNFYSQKKNSKRNLDIWESKYLENENIQEFYKNYEIFYKSKFEENKLVGFIKNDKSWHDVSEFKKNIFRKSLNINLYLE